MSLSIEGSIKGSETQIYFPEIPFEMKIDDLAASAATFSEKRLSKMFGGVMHVNSFVGGQWVESLPINERISTGTSTNNSADPEPQES